MAGSNMKMSLSFSLRLSVCLSVYLSLYKNICVCGVFTDSL